MSRRLPTGSGTVTLAWWIGAVVATALVVVGDPPINTLHLAPETPFDHTGSGHAKQWKFLEQASAVVPAGSLFSIRAADSDIEMSLYMMSVGILPGATAVPNTYYGRPVANREAVGFILDFGAETGAREGTVRTTAVEGGLVIECGP